MHCRLIKFQRILDAECEDLCADIADLIARLEEQFDARAITQHVFFENTASLRDEARLIEVFRREAASIDRAAFTSIDDYAEAIRSAAFASIERDGHAPCIKGMLDRKLAKVKRYVLSQEE